MIPFERNRKQEVPSSALKVIGLGGAGANMVDRAARDGMEGAELLALNTDIRTLAQSTAAEKLQLGPNLTKGLGAGGDPELGKQAVLEVEAELRESLRGREIVFLCVGLGGGTGSGAAPIVTRLAREEGAFVVVFATMPFAFEGRRRREQAETSLNELAVLSNALVTFDNGRMGELVLAKQGIHEAFSAADRMISESIKAVTRLVIRPGLVNVGLDDLMTALKTNRSRCLFGSGLAKGKSRAQSALKKALASPLLDRGSLLNDAESVLVHVSGGPDMTLHEVELLMQGLTKHVPDTAHILFGAAIDEAMGEALSVTIISALPESKLLEASPNEGYLEEEEDPSSILAEEESPEEEPITDALAQSSPPKSLFIPSPKKEEEEEVGEQKKSKLTVLPEPAETTPIQLPVKNTHELEEEALSEENRETGKEETSEEEIPVLEAPAKKKITSSTSDFEIQLEEKKEEIVEEETQSPFYEEPISEASPVPAGSPFSLPEIGEEISEPESEDPEPEEPILFEEPQEKEAEVVKLVSAVDEPSADSEQHSEEIESFEGATDWAEVHRPKGVQATKRTKLPEGRTSAFGGQGELEFDSGPKGRFEGESPNVIDGEDIDVPPYLRKRARKS